MSDSNDKSKQNPSYESRRQMAASHDFPTISTFFSYPPRDEHGYLVPTGRSSKRTAYATTHAGEHIIGRMLRLLGNHVKLPFGDEIHRTDFVLIYHYYYLTDHFLRI